MSLRIQLHGMWGCRATRGLGGIAAAKAVGAARRTRHKKESQQTIGEARKPHSGVVIHSLAGEAVVATRAQGRESERTNTIGMSLLI